MSSKSHERWIETSPAALADAWRAVGSQLAVVAGSGTAFVALLQHTPVSVASFRGAMVWGAIRVVTSIGAWLAAKTWRPPMVDEGEAEMEAEREAA